MLEKRLLPAIASLALLFLGTACRSEFDPVDTVNVDGDGIPPVDPCGSGQTIFDTSSVHELRLGLSEGNWEAMQTEAKLSPEYGGTDKRHFTADFSWDGSDSSNPVGLRLTGHGSLLEAVEEGRNAFPLKVDFNRVELEQTFDGLKKLNLHPMRDDGANLLREYLSYGAVLEYGEPASRVSFVEVFMNDDSLGLYTAVEQIDGRYIQCHFEEPYGQLYKPEEGDGALGPEDVYENFKEYNTVEHKWPDMADHEDFLHFVKEIQDGLKSMKKVANIDGVLTYHAMEAVLGNWDVYSSTGHNYYLYEETDGVSTMLVWDLDNSLDGTDVCGVGRRDEAYPLVYYPLSDENSLKKYIEIVEDFRSGPGGKDRLLERLDDIFPILEDHLGPLKEFDEFLEQIEEGYDSHSAALEDGVQSCPEEY